MTDWRKIETALVEAVELATDEVPFRVTGSKDGEAGDWAIDRQINQGAEGDPLFERINLTTIAKRMAGIL